MSTNKLEISEINDLRAFVREMYIEGYQERGKHKAIENISTAALAKTRIKAFFEENYIKKNNQNEDYIQIDTRSVTENPLFILWKMRLVKCNTVTTDFAVLDLLEEFPNGLTVYDLQNDGKKMLDKYFTFNNEPQGPDKKSITAVMHFLLSNELITETKDSKKIIYKKNDTSQLKELLKSRDALEALHFASDTLPCGVTGSFIIDNLDFKQLKPILYFKHHFIFNVLDTEVIYTLLDAIKCRSFCTISFCNKTKSMAIVPVQIRYSTRNGRTYLVYYRPEVEKFLIAKIENLYTAVKEKECSNYDEIKSRYTSFCTHLWGISLPDDCSSLEHIEFTVYFDDDEEYIWTRLQRENINGTVKRIDKNHAQFSADLYDSSELKIWIRTFIGRLEHFSFSNPEFEKQIENDIKELYEIYQN